MFGVRHCPTWRKIINVKLFIDDLESKVGSLYYDEDFDISDDGIRLEIDEVEEYEETESNKKKTDTSTLKDVE